MAAAGVNWSSLNIQIICNKTILGGAIMAKKATAKTRRYRYDRAEGYCLPTWLTPYEGHAKRFSGIKAAAPSAREFSRRVALLAALQQEVSAMLDKLLISYPGSRAERDYKDLYTHIRQLEAKLQKNSQEV